MTPTQTHAALLTKAAKLANEFRVTMSREVLQEWGRDTQEELRRLDAQVRAAKAALIEEQTEVERLQAILAKLQPAQEPAQAGEVVALGGA